jgi:uncharacterized protein YfaS (alpha-2-macroglobulin family)
MQKIFNWILISILLVFGQNAVLAQTEANNYTKEWAEISKLEYDGLTKSALEASQKLYTQIKADKDNPAKIGQTIKALLFINKYQGRLEEDGLVKSIYRFQEEAKNAATPIKPVLQSMVAEMYNRYLEQHLYKFQDRTATEEFQQEDIRTWDVERITKKTYKLYQASLQFEATKKIDIEGFTAITQQGDNVEGLRPTLYDFLLHRALDFSMSNKYYLTKPAYKFYLDSEEDFADASSFSKRPLVAKDSISATFQALLLFQKGLAFHLNEPRALVDLDLKRLDFVLANSIRNDKDLLYLERLEALYKKHKEQAISTEIAHKIAVYYNNQGQKYQPSPTEQYRWDIKKAYEICQSAIKAFPESYGASHCQNLMSTIESKSIALNVEKVNPIDQPILGLITYKNVSKLYFKAIPLTKVQYNAFNSKYGKARTTYLNNLSGAYKWSEELKNEGDYQQHRVEFNVPKLRNGRYIIAASANENFSHEENGIAYSVFHVSNISFSVRTLDGKQEFYLTDRISGAPLPNVKAELYTSTYNSLLRKYETVKAGTAQSDENGYFQTENLNTKNSYYNNSFSVKMTNKDDELFLDDSYYNYNSSKPYEQAFTTFFLDRAIYRPGQTVYFKGLVLSRMTDGKNPKIVPNQARTVTFLDANYQKIAEVTATTNEYGTFNGSFTAPASGLTGQMQIKDNQNNSSKYLRVEEYKRPKFEVLALPVKESFKINDSVQVQGHAKAYAGNNVDGAKVSYRVVRKANFPYWNWRWGWYIPFNQEVQEIAFGETTTDEKGEYNITFKALADRSIPKENNPEFNYTVYATVTDITGETHSTQTIVRVGYIALDISLSIPENVDRENTKAFTINSKNLNAEFEAASGSVVIEQLKTPSTIYNNRFWASPDYHNILSADKFKEKFPAYAYQNENEQQEWKVVKEVLKTNFDTKKSKELSLKNLKKWPQGTYKVTLKTKDKYDKAIELVKFFTLYSAKEKTTPINNALFVAQESFTKEPGETVTLDFGTHNTAAYVLYEVEHDKQIVKREWIQPKGRTKVSIAIEEKHRGNLHFYLTSTQNNRLYNSGGTIYVPWSNKDLKVEYATFRDKLYPGQEEEWKIKISGNKGDKVAAEFVAGMYDASLDAFAANSWGMNIHPSSYRSMPLQGTQSFYYVGSSLLSSNWNTYSYAQSRTYQTFNWNGFSFYEWDYADGGRSYSDGVTIQKSMSGGIREKSLRSEAPPSPAPEPSADFATEETEESINKDPENPPLNDAFENPEEAPEEDFGDVTIRTNLNETVFFYPDLMTDEEGNIIIKFTMNEALTKWKFMLFGHTKDLASVSETKSVVTQKDLMVVPNAPRFFREKDEIYFTAKVSNMTEEVMNGSAKLQLFDAISMEPIDIAFGNNNSTVPFEAKAGQSAPLVWKLNIPDGWTTAVTHRVVAKAGDFSDGEEAAIPVLTNRMMVTETQPLPIRGNETKDFTFKRMLEVSKSTTMKQHKLTLEFTQNPAWYAIQSLPYLMEYPYECTEQIFSRYYANSLASDVANSHPKVKRVFDQWKNIDTDALKSNLSKNEELKYALLEETPWVLAAQSKEVQKKNVGVLFDLNRMGNELAKARDKMADRQLANGGFSWMPGGRDSWYITQYIVEGMGHLDKLGVKDIKDDPKMVKMIARAVDYIDVELARHYQELLKSAKRSKNEKEYLAKDHLGQMVIHYFYARTFFPEQKITNKTTLEAIKYYEGQALKYWRNKSMYMQGLLALGFHRKGTDLETPKKIVAAAKENALNSEEMGMYWKYPSGYFWYQLPIETHALMIEVFDVVAKDAKAVEDLKVWLLKAKQTTHWKTTKATAAACYALLMSGDNWLMDDQEIEITMAGKKLDQSQIKKEAGTGYFKTTWDAKEITKDMANITVKNPNNVVAWGALYWQYFENLDKITHFKETPLKLNKKLFKQINTDRGPVLKPIDKETLEPGDLIKVRIELVVDRDMEYVHMKDMRAAGLEPTNVLSQYKYQGGLGYYESTRDASTNFFFGYLSKGTYVFEYPLRVNHKGDFSNGITTIQCMYAPEFTAHSEGVRVMVK